MCFSETSEEEDGGQGEVRLPDDRRVSMHVLTIRASVASV